MNKKIRRGIGKILFIFILAIFIFSFFNNEYAAINTKYGESSEVNDTLLYEKVSESDFLSAIAIFVNAIASIFESLIGKVFYLLTRCNEFPWADLTIFNAIPFLDINFINPSENSLYLNNGADTAIAGIVRNIYYTVFSISVAFLGVVVGIMSLRLIFATIAAEKAKYKQEIMNWLFGLILLFSTQYLISFIFFVNEKMVEIASTLMFSSIGDVNALFKDDSKQPKYTFTKPRTKDANGGSRVYYSKAWADWANRAYQEDYNTSNRVYTDWSQHLTQEELSDCLFYFYTTLKGIKYDDSEITREAVLSKNGGSELSNSLIDDGGLLKNNLVIDASGTNHYDTDNEDILTEIQDIPAYGDNIIIGKNTIDGYVEILSEDKYYKYAVALISGYYKENGKFIALSEKWKSYRDKELGYQDTKLKSILTGKNVKFSDGTERYIYSLKSNINDYRSNGENMYRYINLLYDIQFLGNLEEEGISDEEAKNKIYEYCKIEDWSETEINGADIIDSLGNLFKQKAYNEKDKTFEIIPCVLYAMFVVQSAMFLIAYAKRFFYVLILALFSPLVIIYDLLNNVIK